jgi:hypothetical protein
MTSFMRRYTEDIGLVSVTVLSSDSTYIKDKLTMVEELICFKSGRPHLVTIKWTENSKKKFNYKIQKSEEITEDEYRKLLESHSS